MRIHVSLSRARIFAFGRKEMDDMSRKMASFKAKKLLGVTNDEVYRRAVALHNTLFAPTLPAVLKPDVANARPISPRRANPKAATGNGAADVGGSGQVVHRKSAPADSAKSTTDAGGEQKRWQQKSTNPPPPTPKAADERPNKRARFGCFRCGAMDHYKHECPLLVGKSA